MLYGGQSLLIFGEYSELEKSKNEMHLCQQTPGTTKEKYWEELDMPYTVGVRLWRTIKFVQQIWGVLLPNSDHIVCHTLHLFGIRPGTPLSSAGCTRIWILYEAWHQQLDPKQDTAHMLMHTQLRRTAQVASAPLFPSLSQLRVQYVQQTKNHWLSSNSPAEVEEKAPGRWRLWGCRTSKEM